MSLEGIELCTAREPSIFNWQCTEIRHHHHRLYQNISKATMRLLRSSLLGAASVSIAAASAVANVYLYDHDGSSSLHTSRSETIDAETSRLIFAQRLGLSQFHTLKTTGDEALRRINDFGGRQRPLFAAEKPAKGPSKVMIVVEGVDEPMSTSNGSLSFFVLQNTDQDSPSIAKLQVVLDIPSSTPFRQLSAMVNLFDRVFTVTTNRRTRL